MQSPPRSVKAIFDEAHEISEPAARQAFLARMCADAPELRTQVEALLRAYEAAGSFLETPHGPPHDTASYLGATPGTPHGLDASTVAPASPASHAATAEGPGSDIGPYRLVRELGAGGMGAVYLAEQERPIRRQVALKIIKPGMDSAQVIARFEAERQALTLMDHANIARVHDAGTTAHGRPYFVMELVQGVPLARFCDEQRLTIRARLELFTSICHAVQHAHQKGIMHRDLKPSNVLVALQDGKPMPKVIDFGLAKAIEQPLTDQSHLTQAGAIIGTLRYMSPEQADFSDQGVDTRTDIYSLGVMLYELLTGTTPLDLGKPRGDGFLEAVLRIREEEAPRPSTRVAGLGDALPAVATARQTEPARLARAFRGELDWIALKALEKDRGRRYQTASDFARDIERYLNDEPVEACPPSTRYRIGKFARKHRGLLATVTSIFAVLVLGVVGLTWGIIEVNTAQAAEKKQRENAENALKREEQERKRAEASDLAMRKVHHFNMGTIRARSLSAAKPAGGEKVALGKLRKGFKSLLDDTGTSEQHLRTTAETEFGLAAVALMLDEDAEAEASYERAIKIYKRLSQDHPDNPEYRTELARSYFDLAHLYRKRQKRAPALAAFGQALELNRDVVADFPDEPAYWRELADALNDLGGTRREAKDYALAATAFREAVRLGEKAAAQEPKNSAYQVNLGAGYHNLGNVVRDGRDPKAALTWYGKAITTLEPIAPRPANATEYLRNAHWDRANALGQLNQYADAVKDWQRAIKLAQGPAQANLQRFLDADLMEIRLKGEAKPAGPLLYDAATVNARAFKAAVDEDENDLKTRYCRRALELLQQAGETGWLREPARLKELQSNPDFAPLPRDEFAALLVRLR